VPTDQNGNARFLTTRWSVVLASSAAAEPHRRAALEELCARYWYPLYAYVRRSGHDANQAADLTQEFFARLLERDELRRVDPARGRFRNWLLTVMQHFLASERERQRAQKRGGGKAPVAIDAHDADSRFAREPADERTPELSFRRAWAETAIEHALARLRQEQASVGRAAQFDALRPALAAEGDAPPHADVAAALGSSENAVKVALHRLRRRFGELLRDEVGGTLERPADLEDEIRDLFDAFRR
jgi:RNA polymerase sigma-70 factor (ECF subfamily)